MDVMQSNRRFRTGVKRAVYECEFDSDETGEYFPRKRIPISKRSASEIEEKKRERRERNKKSAMDSRNRKNEKITNLEKSNSKFVLNNSC